MSNPRSTVSSRPTQPYHFQADLILYDGTFKSPVEGGGEGVPKQQCMNFFLLSYSRTGIVVILARNTYLNSAVHSFISLTTSSLSYYLSPSPTLSPSPFAICIFLAISIYICHLPDPPLPFSKYTTGTVPSKITF